MGGTYAHAATLPVSERARGHDPDLGGGSTDSTIPLSGKQHKESSDVESREGTVGTVPVWGWTPGQRALTALRA